MNFKEKSRCPICLLEVKEELLSERDTTIINCIRCGKYEISLHALTMFDRSDEQTKRQSVSYWIKHSQLPDNNFVYIDTVRMRGILVPFKEPQPNEQAYNLIVWLGQNLRKPSDYLTIAIEEAESIIGTQGLRGIAYVLKHLTTKGYLKVGKIKRTYAVKLTFSGWEYYYKLQNSNVNSRLAFMAMKFGEPTLDKVYYEVIKPAVEDTGFEIRKLDDVKRAGLIDDKLRIEIRRSRFLISDLSHGNNGAYWEAGYAEGLGLPVIYICEKCVFEDKDRKPHFDTNHHLTVLWENTPEGLIQFSDELKSTIRATLPGEARMED